MLGRYVTSTTDDSAANPVIALYGVSISGTVLSVLECARTLKARTQERSTTKVYRSYLGRIRYTYPYLYIST